MSNITHKRRIVKRLILLVTDTLAWYRTEAHIIEIIQRKKVRFQFNLYLICNQGWNVDLHCKFGERKTIVEHTPIQVLSLSSIRNPFCNVGCNTCTLCKETWIGVYTVHECTCYKKFAQWRNWKYNLKSNKNHANFNKVLKMGYKTFVEQLFGIFHWWVTNGVSQMDATSSLVQNLFKVGLWFQCILLFTTRAENCTIAQRIQL